jgi:predicted amidohydrolase
LSEASTIKVAAAQIQAWTMEQAAQSLAAVGRAVQQAGEADVDLLVLPECAYPAYLIRSVEAYRAADVLPPSEYIITLARLAQKHKLHIVSGYIEDVGTHLYNSAVLIDSAGQQVGTYRKSFLWAADNSCFKPGERISVFETALGRIGMVICADTRAPEIIAKQIMDGAQVIAMPTCWVNVATEPGCYENPQPEFLISARAREFDVPFVCANKYGMETAKVGYCGRSIIASRSGSLLAEAPGDAEMLLVGEIELPERDPGHVPELWESVVCWKEPLRPTTKVLEPVLVAVRPGGPIDAREIERIQSQGVRLLAVNAAPDDPAEDSERFDIVTLDHAGTVRDFGIGKVGCVVGEEFRRFERARLLALGGAEIICVFDAPDDVRLMRARAIENRTFILAVGREIGAIVSPGGELLAYSSRAGDDGLTVEINVADAAVKTVAPHTDIWEQRRVASYR